MTLLVKAIGTAISRLPPAIKVGLLVGAALVVLHPPARKRVTDILTTFGQVVIDVWPTVVQLMEKASQKQFEAQDALGRTERLLEVSRADAG